MFRGDKTRWNPELELVAALSQCHMLCYLHVCATAGVVVTALPGRAVRRDGGDGRTAAATSPRSCSGRSVTVAAADMADAARELHEEASEKCFIASSVNFPVRHEPAVTVAARA